MPTPAPARCLRVDVSMPESGHAAGVAAPPPVADDGGLAALLAPGLAPLVGPPPSAAARCAHAPFLHWLVQAIRPLRVAAAGAGGAVTAALREAVAQARPSPDWAGVPTAGTDLVLI